MGYAQKKEMVSGVGKHQSWRSALLADEVNDVAGREFDLADESVVASLEAIHNKALLVIGNKACVNTQHGNLFEDQLNQPRSARSTSSKVAKARTSRLADLGLDRLNGIRRVDLDLKHARLQLF